MKRFGNIAEINPADKQSWEGRIFLTFDIDWAHEEIILDCHNFLREAGVPSTWFITHSGNYLNTLKKDELLEIGIHPNFNKLIDGISKYDCKKIIEDLQVIYPQAVSIRSHSLLQSERLLDLFKELGLTHVSNMYIPHDAGFEPNPFFLWDHIAVIPHTYQDNAEMRSGKQISLKGYLNRKNYGVILMHPIHVYLNSSNMNVYEQTREYHQQPDKLIKYRECGYGIRDSLREALEDCL